jgi:hypothetical protein
VAAWKKLSHSLDIHGQPIGAKQFREMLVADGWDSNDNSFSSELIAMREE